MLAVHPKVRHQGLGSRLVDECIRFAKSVGYNKITVSSYKTLVFAQRIYLRNGFKVIKEAKRNKYGPDLIGQIYQLSF